MNFFYADTSSPLCTTFSFVFKGKPVEQAPVCGMTLRQSGSMRFRWNESNPLRDRTLRVLADKYSPGSDIVPVELIHSKTVYKVSSFKDVEHLQGDGIISCKDKLFAVVTVADCMPLYLYDNKTRAFGIVHSGWKGSGIAVNAVTLMKKEFGSKEENISVILGPHINDCCYIVNEERAEYFVQNFGKNCVKPLETDGKCYCGGKGLAITWNNGEGQLYRLSLKQANLNALQKAGIYEDNISVSKDCTCCNPLFGSNRRETAENRTFTVQAAFIVKQTL